MTTVEGYLAALRRQGKERVRLTVGLQRVVGQALEVIAAECALGARYTLHGQDGFVLAVQEIVTVFSRHRYIIVPTKDGGPWWDGSKYVVFDYTKTPGTSWYLDGDFDVRVRCARRARWLALANALPLVVKGFLDDDSRVRAQVRESLQFLATWSAEEGEQV